MENQTEFDLNHAIRNWREHLSQSPSYRAENLDELESHLRDSVAVLASRGLSEEEAFLIATRRVGKPQALEPEFAKVNGREVWLGRLLWMLVGIQAWGLISTFSSAFSRAGIQLLIVSFLEPSAGFAGTDRALFGNPVSQASGIAAILFFLADLVLLAVITAGGWWMLRRNAESMSQWVRGSRRLIMGGIALCFAIILGSVISQWSFSWIARSVGPAAYGEIAWSMSVANLALFALKTITLAALTVLLARRQWRQTTA